MPSSKIDRSRGRSDMLLIGTDGGVYRWAEGNSWPVFHALQDRAIVGLSAHGSGGVVAIDDAGLIWETSNNGLNWRNLTVPDGAGTPVSLAVGGDPSSAGLVAISTVPTTLYSRTMGSSLVEPKPFLTSLLESVESLPTRFRKPAANSKGGTAVAAPVRKKAPTVGWKKLGTPKGSPSNVLRLLRISPTGWFAGLQGAGLYRSTDAGANWQKVDGIAAEVVEIRPLTGTDTGLIAATNDGIWVSTDSGQNWASQSTGLDAATSVRVVDSHPTDPKVLLAAVNAKPGDTSTGDVLYDSNDGGKTWKRVVRSFPENPRYDRITDVRFDPATPDNIAVAFASGELWMTVNGGAYWQPFARQIKAARVLCPVG